ncbi:hypothetical protein ZIOFF_066825 [Zingiber officinale]|uniref:WRKY domain-containing protein n=1 Tax=Zingiber officinale TaxID=94328 RepID=A0A8J5KE84_ZINOF|nr:hypothetical protein ZIOFF_066825 [Zingiber officinale]
MTDFNNFKSYFLPHDQGLQPSQDNDQNFLLRQSQRQNEAALHVDIPHSTNPRQLLNFDYYANNAILFDDANAQMMCSNELLESEQYALAMVEKYHNNNNNNENQLENEVEGAVAKPLMREVSKAIGNPPSDGYNWRKYGQKNVKGNNFPRNYYKCTYPNCEAKKKVEYSAEGYAAEIIYKGSHDHPQVNPSCDLVSIYLAQEMADNLDNEYVATSQMSSSSRSVRQQKWVAQLVSDHEVLDDGYRWRKYGQKTVKGNLKPRNYYMCTHHGCIVKKHVEKEVDDHNRNILLITYEGLHNHGIPMTKHNIDNNLHFPFAHHNQAKNLQFETRVEATTTANQEERFMRFECPNPLKTVHATPISVEQCPRPNLGYRPIIMPYVGIRGKVERTQEFNASSSRTQLPMQDNVLQGFDMTVTMAPSQSRRILYWIAEQEQFALAMVSSEKTRNEEHNNNNKENQLKNEVAGVVAELLPREVSKAIGNPASDGYNWRTYRQKKMKGTSFQGATANAHIRITRQRILGRRKLDKYFATTHLRDMLANNIANYMNGGFQKPWHAFTSVSPLFAHAPSEKGLAGFAIDFLMGEFLLQCPKLLQLPLNM